MRHRGQRGGRDGRSYAGQQRGRSSGSCPSYRGDGLGELTQGDQDRVRELARWRDPAGGACWQRVPPLFATLATRRAQAVVCSHALPRVPLARRKSRSRRRTDGLSEASQEASGAPHPPELAEAEPLTPHHSIPLEARAASEARAEERQSRGYESREERDARRVARRSRSRGAARVGGVCGAGATPAAATLRSSSIVDGREADARSTRLSGRQAPRTSANGQAGRPASAEATATKHVYDLQPTPRPAYTSPSGPDEQSSPTFASSRDREGRRRARQERREQRERELREEAGPVQQSSGGTRWQQAATKVSAERLSADGGSGRLSAEGSSGSATLDAAAEQLQAVGKLFNSLFR